MNIRDFIENNKLLVIQTIIILISFIVVFYYIITMYSNINIIHNKVYGPVPGVLSDWTLCTNINGSGVQIRSYIPPINGGLDDPDKFALIKKCDLNSNVKYNNDLSLFKEKDLQLVQTNEPSFTAALATQENNPITVQTTEPSFTGSTPTTIPVAVPDNIIALASAVGSSGSAVSSFSNWRSFLK